MIRVGIIDFTNSFPLFYALKKGIIQHSAEFICGKPSEINEKLRHGEIDTALISSYEYLQNCTSYDLFTELGIGATGPVMSVRLFFKPNIFSILPETSIPSLNFPPEAIPEDSHPADSPKPSDFTRKHQTKRPYRRDARAIGSMELSCNLRDTNFRTLALASWATIYIPPYSATSVRLLRILCSQFWNISPSFTVYSGDPKALFSQDIPFLLIGDTCLKYMDTPSHSSLDLSQCWHGHTSKSFVFAVIASRKDSMKKRKDHITRFYQALHESCLWAKHNMDDIIDHASTIIDCNKDLPKMYYSCLEHCLHENHFEGLEHFSALDKSTGN
jgi:predicted solute-binding protein